MNAPLSDLESLYPNAKLGEFYLLKMQSATHKLLCLDGSIWTEGCEKEAVMVFPSFKSARDCAEDTLKHHPEVAFTIQDRRRNPVATIKDFEFFDKTRSQILGEVDRKWWKFWKLF